MRRDGDAVNGQHMSSTAEHYTPAMWVEMARTVMGGIDCDPASCAAANEVVQAKVWYGAEDDGLARECEWHGRLLVNPPGSCHDVDGELTTCRVQRGPGERPKRSCTCGLPVAFFRKLSAEVAAYRVSQFIWIAFNLSQLRTLQADRELLEECSVYIPARRIRFTGASPTKDNAILYWGPHRRRFHRACLETADGAAFLGRMS